MDILNDQGKLIFIVISIVVLIELAVGLFLFFTAKKFVSNSRLVKAKVTKLEPLKKETVLVNLSFKDPLGKTIITSIKAFSGKYTEGEELEIMSNKNNPSKVRINSFVHLWAIPLVAILFSIILAFFLGICVFIGFAKLPF